ncbi:L-methionine (R)-S-oxide reductase Ecym_2285 [Eremothecium cymbalariae DBVPG|uniref:GAF domain-containing protein n=1 Tax=Eremothecium cymbalariae (strain CBS 270.75 / DBVPG 7215 / KCTC 17166 / NRRL Y-17582) TaxID=931890 RepID=G8JPS4_ERECY|nr:Hypothetical protein Ecym_2285 [Eremothecium cymbalariae DBVPG\
MADSGHNDNIYHAEYSNYSTSNKEETLEQLNDSYRGLVAGQDNLVCNLANASSLLWYAYKNLGINVNWAGFYITKKDNDQKLILGPFQGKVACQEIQFGSGVCGTAALNQQTEVVSDVSKFPGHIPCDGETKSEIVVPIILNNKTVALIDIDCLDYDAFGDVDRRYLEELASLIVETCKF